MSAVNEILFVGVLVLFGCCVLEYDGTMDTTMKRVSKKMEKKKNYWAGWFDIHDIKWKKTEENKMSSGQSYSVVHFIAYQYLTEL